MERTVFLNGEFMPEGAAQLPIFDRGLLFADSVYEGFGILDSTVYNGERWSTERAYLNPARSRSNLKVITEAHVQKVFFKNKKAVGVLFKNFKGNFLLDL